MGVRKTFGDTVKQGFEGRGLEAPAQGMAFGEDGETVVCTVRLHTRRKAALKRILAEQGIGLGPGIRMIVYQWLDSQQRRTP